MALSLKDILGGSLLDGISQIISQFKMSPEDKANLQLKLQENADAVQAAEDDYNAKLNDIAGQNIRAEAESGDKFTVRARPAVIWMGNLLVCWNYGLVPMAGLHWHLQPATLPDAFWWTWGTVVTGYVFNRTAEKIMQMPGDSSIKLPMGIQIGQKS